MPFELIPLDEFPETHWTDEPPPAATNPHQPHCPCGRFAKFLGVRYGYNGHHTIEIQTTDCSRCGVQEMRLT